MPLSEKMQKELMATFQKELEEHLSTLNKGLLALEKNPPPDERNDILTGIFRAAHSLKGASRFVNLKDIEVIAHRMESALDAVRKGNIILKALQIDAFLKAADTIGLVMTSHMSGEKVPDEFIKDILDSLDKAATVESKQELTEQPSVDLSANEKKPDDAITPGIAAKPSSSAAKPPEHKPYTARPITTDDTIRVATKKLDALMGSLSELMVVRMREDQIIEHTKTLQQRTVLWKKNWRKIRPVYNKFKRDKAQPHSADITKLIEFMDINEQQLNAISNELNELVGKLKNDRSYLYLVTDELQNGIRNARMLPVVNLFDIFPRMVRDLAHDFGKDIVLEMTGQETEVDRQVLELMKDPLMHILRNAVDHGIELPEERLSKGKPRFGTISINAEQRGNNLVITVSDDGKGIDLEAVRRSAGERGLMPPDKATGLNDKETVELIFFSGLSTARQITDISGRGVGMDVVRQNLEQMHGLIQVETTPGIGTTFILMLPLTFATSQVVLMRVADEIVAMPMMNIERMLHIHVKQIGTIEGRPAIIEEGRSLPLISLAHVLGLQDREHTLRPDSKIPVVIVSVIEKHIALRVDAFLSTHQVVIKSLGKQLRRVRNIAGVTVLGDGRLVTVLNVADIMKSVHTGAVISTALPLVTKEIRRRRLMVVDDSITTRTLEKHILENAGYEVAVMVDGQQAWEFIRENEKTLPDLIVSDIDMPRMNGFDLTRAIKNDARFARIPVVLVTSLDSQNDRLQGMESGADAYIVKSSFEQKELLETIERLIA